ncbi:MAG: ATP-binding cassette domain-containing protein [Acidimicrobiia bacterium]|nr:ATP-binding cassette domain-containing protein [Acidimicrobiia bacterium]
MPSRVEAEHVTHRFDDVVAVNDISLRVAPGEVVGLLGANGAGKTTLIRILLGLLSPTEGSVTIMGEPPSRATRRHLGYVPQTLGLYEDLTISENVAFAAGAFDVPAPNLEGDLKSMADTPVSALPLGIKRRAAFAVALCHDPDLLVLDEPTSGVGPLGRNELWGTIHDSADKGAAVLVTTHHMDEAEQCDRLLVMADGREVAAGTIDEIVSGLKTVEIASNDPVIALAALEAAGLLALPAGRMVRVPGCTEDAVTTGLDGVVAVDSIQTVPATLEEAFMTMVART